MWPKKPGAGLVVGFSVSLIVTSTSPLRVGVVGAGFFGRLHARKYAALPGVELIGIADPESAAAGDAAAQAGCAAYGDHRDMIGQVDAVSIASPASTHAAVALDFLRAGVHVLVEKPLAVSLADADAMIAEAKRSGLILQTGHQERYVFAASGLLSRGKAPLAIECHRAGPFTGRGTDVSVVLDLMTHDLDLVHQLAPAPVASVKAVAHHLPASWSDEVKAILRLKDGCRVSLFASRMADARRRFMRVSYDDGVIEIDFIHRTVENSTPEAIAPAFFPSRDGTPGIADDPLGFAIARFVESAQTGARPLVTPEDARRALDSALSILEAARSPAMRPRALMAAD